jgi:hypothetical protein
MGLFSDYLSERAFAAIAFLVVIAIFVLLVKQNKLTRLTGFLTRVSPGVRILIYLIFAFMFLQLLKLVY